MIEYKEDRTNFFGIALFIMLFFLFVSSHSDKAVNHSNESLKFELISQFHSNPLSADVVTVITLPAFRGGCVSTLEKMNFRHYDEPLKMCLDNKANQQTLLSVHREEILTNQIVFYRYYYHLFSLVSSDLPSLS
jgi:hypothetical protein